MSAREREREEKESALRWITSGPGAPRGAGFLHPRLLSPLDERDIGGQHLTQKRLSAQLTKLCMLCYVAKANAHDLSSYNELDKGGRKGGAVRSQGMRKEKTKKQQGKYQMLATIVREFERQ